MSLAVLVFPRATAEMVRRHAAQGATVIAIDGGADVLRAAGLGPHVVVGDLDSVSAATLAQLERAGARIERHPAAKRDTDAALALAHAKGHDAILFLGAGGGRPDHALANLHLLVEAAQTAAVCAIDEEGVTWVAAPGRPLQLDLPEGATVSVLPVDAECEGVGLEGFAYPLEGATMRLGDPYGVSNVARAPPQRVAVARGRLVVIAPSPRLL